MSVDVSSSSYSPDGGPESGLGYSRHYAQRIRDMGKSSKESWIKRLWNHMFKKDKSKDSKKEKSTDCDEDEYENMGASNSAPTSLPPINRENSLINTQQTSERLTVPKDAQQQSSPPKDGGNHHHVQFSTPQNSDRSSKAPQEGSKRGSTNSAPSQSSMSSSSNRSKSKEKPKSLPMELANSPYIGPRDRGTYKIDNKGSGKQQQQQQQPNPPREPKKSRDQLYMRRPVHPYLSQQQDTWRPRITRAPNMINLEKRARSVSEKAMKEAKIFTCVGPYPVDAYVRCGMRKRGWVEKFGPKANACTRTGTSSKLECQDDEDFVAIVEQHVPAPWEEDHGVYAVMSRISRHYPAKFIWGGRNVNSLILKNEVTVNHFPKARYFSSKVLLSQSLRELPWQNDGDPRDFFPRCYVLGDEDKDDITEDFRTTACVALLKWVLRMYIKDHGSRRDPPIHRENTKYEEVTSSKDCETERTIVGSIFDDIVTPEPSGHGMFLDNSNSNSSKNNDCSDDKTSDSEQAASDPSEDGLSIDGDTTLELDKTESAADCSGEDYEEPCADDDAVMEESKKSESSERAISSAGTVRTVRDNIMETPDLRRSKSSSVLSCKTLQIDDNTGLSRVLPNLKPQRVKNGGEVPTKAVEWALLHLERYIKGKNNEDLDIKKRDLSVAQWNQLLSWYYQVSQTGAKVLMTEGRLKEVEEMLRKMRRICPQYEMDGKRNIWIVKPGDKSKGIGIEFLDKMEDISKYINNSTTQGTYVLQKYIERPLLIHKCKFDIRQWFLVTDWNPLTIWFYRESYLRICSQEFQYDSMHESVHLSNVAVQQNYINGQRSGDLPDNNYLTSTEFKKYLADYGHGSVWSERIYPGMRHAINNTLIATQDVIENRKNAFELYGADFMISEDFRPWLIEINACPGMAPTSKEKAKLCARVIEDTLKVVLDRRENRGCPTGGFELAFKDNPIPQTKCYETKFMLEGQRIRKPDLQRYTLLDQKNTKTEQDKERREREKQERAAAKAEGSEHSGEQAKQSPSESGSPTTENPGTPTEESAPKAQEKIQQQEETSPAKKMEKNEANTKGKDSSKKEAESVKKSKKKKVPTATLR